MVDLFAIYRGMLLANEMDIVELVCYSDLLHYINLVHGPPMLFHIYAVLIQDIKYLTKKSNVTIFHTLC